MMLIVHHKKIKADRLIQNEEIICIFTISIHFGWSVITLRLTVHDDLDYECLGSFLESINAITRSVKT